MHARGWWWLRLFTWQWANRWRAFPVRSLIRDATWALPSVVLPAAIALAGPAAATATQQALLSVDVPLALLLAALTTAAILRWSHAPDPLAWVLAPATRTAAHVRRLRLVATARWPLGFALASLILHVAGEGSSIELWSMALAGLVGGVALAWILAPPAQAADITTSRSRVRRTGVTALSWAPWLEVLQQLRVKRLATLSIPVMLAAPMGSSVQFVISGLLAWLPVLALVLVLREAALASSAMCRWLPGAPAGAGRLRWWAWRHALLTTALGALLFVAAMHAMHGANGAKTG
jgi:hypothetical protein